MISAPSPKSTEAEQMRSSSASTATSISEQASGVLEDQNEYEDAEQNYNVKSTKFWLIILSVYISHFTISIDRMIIATAIPAITNTFSSITDIGWYGSAYMLTCAIFNPLFGKIYQNCDTKLTYLVSIIIFEAGSALCGAAPSSIILIIGRAVAGIGAAGISSGAIMVILPLVPLRKRPVFTAFLGISFAVSSVLGPLVGGSFTDTAKLTWRWCFYINLPIGALAFAAILFLLHLPAKPKEQICLTAQIKRLDPLGLLFFVPSMVCFILALQWGGTTYPWSAPRVVGLLVTSAFTMVAFLFVEFKFPDTAMAPPRIVLNRSIGGAMLFTFFLAGGMMNAVYFLAIWFQAAQGQNAMEAGIRTIPLVLSLVLFGIVSAIITQKIGYYVPAMLMLPIFTSIGGGLLATLTPDASVAKWVGYQFLYGFGLGIGAQASNLAVQTVLPRSDVALGSALMFFVQQLGGSIFLAVGQSIFSQKLVDRLSGIAGLDAVGIVNTGATELHKVVPASELPTVINAYSYAITRVFVLTALLSAISLVGALLQEWRSIKDKGQPIDRRPKQSEKVSAAEV